MGGLKHFGYLRRTSRRSLRPTSGASRSRPVERCDVRNHHAAWRYAAPAATLALAAALWCLPYAATAQPTGELPKELEGAGVDEKLGEILPADIILLDEEGNQVELGSYFDGTRPVLLNLVYHDCPMLCGLVVQGLTKALAQMAWVPGEEFDVLTVSFNAAEGPEMAAAAKAHAIHMLGNPQAAAGWHFLTGTQNSIDRLTDAVGFRYRWIEDQQEFAHPSVLMFVSGERMLARYIYGIEYDPKDVRTALVEASNGTVGSTIDRLILYCFQYDSDKNSYVPHALNLMKMGGLLTVVTLGGMLFIFWRRESRRTDEAAVA